MNDEKIVIVVNAITPRITNFIDTVEQKFGKEVEIVMEGQRFKGHSIAYILFDDLIPETVCYEQVKQSDYKNRKKHYWQKGRW